MNPENTKNAVNIFNKLAKEYQLKFMNVDEYADSLNIFCNHIKKDKARVLELGCGPGNITKYILSINPELIILATDLAPKMLELAQINNPTIQTKLLDCRNISYLNQKFNGIIGGFCLPYLSKQQALNLIVQASKSLESNGILYLSTIEDDNSNSAFKKGSTGDEIFMNYHQLDYLSAAFTQNNLDIIKLIQKETNNPNGTKANELVIIGIKN